MSLFGSKNVTYTNDAFVAGTNFGQGRRTGITDQSGSTAIVYDARGSYGAHAITDTAVMNAR